MKLRNKQSKQDKIPDNRRYINLTSILLAFAILCVFGYFIGGGITGFVVYEIAEHTKQWDFINPSEYVYDDSLINLSNNVNLAQNIEIITIEDYSYENYYVSKALYNPNDKTDKVNALDNEKFEANEENIFDFMFEEGLYDGDIIHLYMKSGEANEIFLCDLGNECNSPGYGKVDYDGGEGWYNITVSGLSEESNGFNINQNEDEAKFNYVYATHGDEEISISKALYNPNDKTDNVNALDNEKFEVNKENLFNVIFDSKINNEDTVALYIKSGTASEVYLCDYNDLCSSPGYGKVDYDSGEGWYNITISGLSEPTKYMNIDPDHVKIDYIYAYKLINNSYNIENITYQTAGTVDTEDFSVENFGQWGVLSVDELLNSQNIDYYYSADSGENWNLISNFNLSEINSSKIRFRIELTSDGTATPVLNSITLSYQTRIACEEDWTLYYGECASNNTKLKYYTDENNCGSADNIPEDNNTYEECDYCTPSWSCLSYGDCQSDSKKYCNQAIDANDCYNKTGLAEDNYTGNYSEFISSCGYDNNPPVISNLLINPNKGAVGTIFNISLSLDDDSNISFAEAVMPDSESGAIRKVSLYENGGIYTGIWNTTNLTEGTYLVGINVSDTNNNNAYYKQREAIALANSSKGSFTDTSVSLLKNQTVVINATEATDTIIEITARENLNMPISAAQYSENLKDITPSKTPAGKYVDIIVNEIVNQNITKVKIIIYYNESEINEKNIDEDTLKIYYYNETNENWDILNSSINTTDNYVWAELSHLSTYGVFGEQKTATQSSVPDTDSGGSGGGGSGGGGGGGVGRSTLIQPTDKEEVLNNVVIVKEAAPCFYDLTIDLPEKISFIGTDAIKGTLKNNGDCVIDEINLSLNKELSNITFIENDRISNISINETKEIYIKPRKQASERLELGILGFAVKPFKQEVKNYTGELTGKGISNNTVVIEKKAPISVGVPSSSEEWILDPLLVLGIIITVIIFIVFMKRIKRAKKINS